MFCLAPIKYCKESVTSDSSLTGIPIEDQFEYFNGFG